MPEFRYPDGSWPRPIKGVATAICCVDGTASANQAEHFYHASGHYYGGLPANVKNPLRCQLVLCSSLASSAEELASHVHGPGKLNLVNGDESIDHLYALLRAAQPPPRHGFRLDHPLSPPPRPRPSSSRPGPTSGLSPQLQARSLSPPHKLNSRKSGLRLGMRTNSKLSTRLGLRLSSSLGSRRRRKAASRSNYSMHSAMQPSAKRLLPALSTPSATPPPILPLLPHPPPPLSSLPHTQLMASPKPTSSIVFDLPPVSPFQPSPPNPIRADCHSLPHPTEPESQVQDSSRSATEPPLSKRHKSLSPEIATPIVPPAREVQPFQPTLTSISVYHRLPPKKRFRAEGSPVVRVELSTDIKPPVTLGQSPKPHPKAAAGPEPPCQRSPTAWWWT